MKKYAFITILSTLICLIFISSSIVSVIPQNTNVLHRNFTIEERNSLKDHLFSNATSVANTLINNAIPTNSTGLKWDKYYNLTDNSESEYYYGFYYGAAGIGNYFTNLYNQTLNQTYLDIAIKAYNFISINAIRNGTMYEALFNSTGFVFWTRSEDALTVYTGIKYGNAGISKFLFNLYQNTNNNSILTLAEESLNTLIDKSILASSFDSTKRGIYWGYSFYGTTPISDIIYGNAGIASSFLDGYLITKNQTYLNEAEQSLEYILSESAITDNTTNGQRYVRFSPDPSYPIAFAGYLTGASGVGTVFLKYYQITKNTDFLLFARQFGNWLAANEKNGLWQQGGADLLTGQANEDGSYTGYGAGSAGIGIFLLDLYNSTKDVSYLKTINDITDMFTKEAQVSTNQISLPIETVNPSSKIVQSDLKMGMAGIGLYFSSLYYYFGVNESLNFMYGIVNFFKAHTDTNGIIPTTLSTGADAKINYDLSLLEGLAGIGTFYLQAFKSLNSTPIFNSAIYYSQKAVKSSPGFETVSLSVICLIIMERKLKR